MTDFSLATPASLDADRPAEDAAAHAFIARWQGVAASELATAQSFVIELCELLGVPRPHATPEQDYMFERPVTFQHGDGSTSSGRIDCYRRGCFVLEAKKLRAAGHTKGFDDGMLRAHSQAMGYARALPVAEGRPPFVLVVDVGHVIELYAEFSQSGGAYTPYPDARSHRLALADLGDARVRQRLRQVWLEPHRLNPALISAEVTRTVAALLARLARSLEASLGFESNRPQAHMNHRPPAPEIVANYLTRCLFSMFAEDVQLLPEGSFQGLLQKWRDDPARLRDVLRALWCDMDRGGFSGVLSEHVLHFNGKLFKGADEAGYSLLLTPGQVDLLIEAARANWRQVEPAIFGTLLERALDPAERHALGAHYTPRAYVERLVLPTVIEPLRRRWQDARAAALVLAREAAALQGRAAQTKLEQARAELRAFHHHLCSVRVLDPACGSANFLYVTLEHLKRLEGEVVDALQQLGQTQDQLGFEGETVTLQQLLGIELNARAAALAELVLWIGWLQWHIRARGRASVAEPVVHAYGNIECRDAVLAWDTREPALDAAGQPLSRWDGQTFKPHPVTGQAVPDEAARVPQWRYAGARKAAWPQADYIVGNPPLIGKSAVRAALGDGYVEALRDAWPEVPDSADFVMYWWQHAAAQVAAGRTQRMGLITTNSLRQTFNRRVVQAALDAGTHLDMAIADHPWVDSANGAAVRIAMTLLAAGRDEEGRLLTVTRESAGEHGEVQVALQEQTGLIHADLSVGANVAAAIGLRAMQGVSGNGVMLAGAGFIVTPDQAAELADTATPAAALFPLPAGEGGCESQRPPILRDYRNGRDLTDKPRGVLVIDAFGLSADELRGQYPAIYQWLADRVKPERDQNNRAKFREQWWLFGEPRRMLRRALNGLPRYIATVETAKHRVFQFLDASILPDHMLIAIALDDAYALGILSSQLHVDWALATGGTLEDRPRYNKSRCFETFPFPADDTGLTDALRQRIAALAGQIDAHRKQVLAAGHAGLTLTGLYNVLAALREGRALNPKEQALHAQGLVGVLRELHDELDAAVLAAYGLPAAADTQQVLAHLVQLNARRAAEEAAGQVRWLRPDFQNPQQSLSNQELEAVESKGLEADLAPNPAAAPAAPAAQPWPASLPEQVRAVADVLAASGAPLRLADLEARFKGRGPWKKGLPLLLQTLEALGRAQAVALPGGVAAWRG